MCFTLPFFSVLDVSINIPPSQYFYLKPLQSHSDLLRTGETLPLRMRACRGERAFCSPGPGLDSGMGEGSSPSLEPWLRTTDSSVPFVCVIHNRWLCWRKSIWRSEVLWKGTWSVARIPLLSRGLFLNNCARAPSFAAALSSVPRVTPLSIALIYTSAYLHIITAVVEAGLSSLLFPDCKVRDLCVAPYKCTRHDCCNIAGVQGVQF